MKILVVDDAEFMRKMIRGMLEKLGHEVVGEAVNGVEGLSKYMQLQPDAVTMDITMPEVGGLECVKRIRAYDSNAQIIMCSAMGQEAMVVDAIRAGARDFIIKPFQQDRLAAALSCVKRSK